MDVLDRCKPRRRPVTWSFTRYQRHEQSGKHYYEVIDLETARQPQTILAYEMNGVPLPIPHGAPLRLRVENELGFKMVKYLRAIEAVADYRSIGKEWVASARTPSSSTCPPISDCVRTHDQPEVFHGTRTRQRALDERRSVLRVQQGRQPDRLGADPKVPMADFPPAAREGPTGSSRST